MSGELEYVNLASPYRLALVLLRDVLYAIELGAAPVLAPDGFLESSYRDLTRRFLPHSHDYGSPSPSKIA